MAQVVDLRKIKKAKKIKVETEEFKPKDTIPAKIEWTAPEFIKYKKNKNWFILPGILAVALIIIAIILKNFLLTIGIIIAAFTVYVYAKKEPRKIKFAISGRGIQLDNQIHRYDDLKSFWIFYYPPEVKEISLRSKKMLMPYIKLPLGNQNPAEVRRLLLRFLPERPQKESAIEEWTRRIRF